MYNKRIDILIECLQSLTKRDIKDAFPEDVVMIAKNLGLNINDMSLIAYFHDC